MAGGSRGRVASAALRAARAGAPYGLGLVLGVLALGPALKPGFTLAYDMVFVPDPPITAATFGMTGTLPRAVPSDAVVALLGTVLPADLVQKALLLGIFVLASAGAAALVPGQGMAARLAAGAFYAWNPFVAERLLIGQWAFLLGYAGLPWAVRAAARLHRPGGIAGLVRALIPAAIGGFTPMIVTALTILPVTLLTPPTPRTNGKDFGGSTPGHAPKILPHNRGPRTGTQAAANAVAPPRPPGPLRALLGPFRMLRTPRMPGTLRTSPTPEAPGTPTGVQMPRTPRMPGTLRTSPTPEAPETPTGVQMPRTIGAVGGLGVCGVLALPWLVPSLLRPGGVAVDPAGVAAFAARADTPFGGVGSLFLLGGIWNAETVPTGYGDLLVSTMRLFIALAALAAVAVFLRARTPYRSKRRIFADDLQERHQNPSLKLGLGGLAVAGALGFGIACLGLMEPGRAVLRSMIEVWPGFAVLRDAQQYVAPLALLQAVGFGLLVAFAVGRTSPRRADPAGRDKAGQDRAGQDKTGRDRAGRDRAGRDRAGRAFAVFGVVAPVLLLPSLALGAGGRLGVAEYPEEWLRVRELVAADPVAGDVLALPWGAHRRYAWNADRTVLDPMPRFLNRRVVADDAVQVGNVRLAPEAPRAAAVPSMLAGDGDLTERLRRAGFRYVIIDAGGPRIQNVFHFRLKGATRVHNGPQLTAYRLVTPAPYTEKSPPAWAVGTAFGVAFMAILWSLAISGSSLLPRSRVLREESL